MSGRASTRFSTMVHSTSSSWMITSCGESALPFPMLVPESHLFQDFDGEQLLGLFVFPQQHLIIGDQPINLLRSPPPPLTFPKDPFPSTVMKLKSDAFTTSFCICSPWTFWPNAVELCRCLVIVALALLSAPVTVFLAYPCMSAIFFCNRSMSCSSSGGIRML